MKILCVTHADFETPGVIENWAKDHCYDFTICEPYKGDNPLGYYDFDMLILMGGPQTATELKKYPYLIDEIQLTKQAIKEDKVVLGFCLGAQIIGEALGGETIKSPEKEVGVYAITLTKEGQKDPLFEGFQPTFPVIHWHNDMPGMAGDSVLLAASAGCPRQVIRYGERVYGFQCHLEIAKAGISKMIEACPEDLNPSKYTQNAVELKKQDYASINNMLMIILERLVKKAVVCDKSH